MRFGIYDGIVETHVASSLERAMRGAGHEVYNTGKIGHGFKFASSRSDLHRLSNHLDRLLEWAPDVILVFRPASLPYELLRRAKATGAKLIVWLSDDPVLWDLTYGPVLDEYDLVLHCGTERVLRFYEEQFGRPTGVNFPFWTDSIAFPYVFGREERETDALFLGNVHDTVRRRRYFDLGSLNSSVRIHGGVGTDYYNLWGGFLDSDQEVVQAGARAAVAINIPQFFKDHYGLETWFPGLDRLGFFQYPSRVIQYAALGLPVISLVPTPEDLRSFPEIVTVGSMAELDDAIQSVSTSPDLHDLSGKTYRRFRNNYSAASRVMAIESLLEDDSWRSLDAADRTDWFLQFVPSEVDHAKILESEAHATGNVSTNTVDDSTKIGAPINIRDAKDEPKHILVVGTAFRRVTSPSAVVARALRSLGHTVSESDAWNNPFLVPDPNNQFKYVLHAAKFEKAVPAYPDIVLVTDIDFGLTQSAADTLEAKGTKLCVVGASYSAIDPKFKRLAARSNLVCVNNPNLAESAQDHGLHNVIYVPSLVDQAFIELAAKTGPRRNELAFVARRALHLEQQAPAFNDLKHLQGSRILIEESPRELETLAGLAEALNVAVILAAYDASRPGPLPSELLPFALASGALVVTPRGIGPMHLGTPGVEALCVREPGELKRKLARLAVSQNNEADDHVAAAQKLASTDLLAERRLRGILATLMMPVAETKTTVEPPRVQVGSTLDRVVGRNGVLEVSSRPDQKTHSILRVEVQHSISEDVEPGLWFHITALSTGDTVGESIRLDGQTSIVEFHYPEERIDGRLRLSTTQTISDQVPAARYEGRIVRMSWHKAHVKHKRLEVHSSSPTAQLYRRFS